MNVVSFRVLSYPSKLSLQLQPNVSLIRMDYGWADSRPVYRSKPKTMVFSYEFLVTVCYYKRLSKSFFMVSTVSHKKVVFRKRNAHFLL